MWSPVLLFLLLTTAVLAPPPQPPPPPPPPPQLRGLRLDCGAAAPSPPSTPSDLPWLPDAPFLSSAGSPRTLFLPGLLPVLSTLRSFPLPRRKSCYALPVVRRTKYLVRTAFFYDSPQPPVFDQIVDGTFWTVVNTTADRERRFSSYYEGVFLTRGKTMSVCLAPNRYTDSDPFISSLEVFLLGDSVYNSTDFRKNAMGLVARSVFGYSGPTVRFPDDRFDRFWQPFTGNGQTTSSTDNTSASDLWNLPPTDVFRTALTADQNSPVELQWPPLPLPDSSYYIALYFADTSVQSSRTFDVYINGYSFYNNLLVTSSGLSVFATQWNLSGLTNITLIPESGRPPLINAGEIFGLFPIGRITLTRDVIVLESIKRSINNLPLDWNGDPCLPREFSWTGITCFEGSRVRVIAINLTGMGLSGSLSSSIANLTALSELSFANNNITGPIPNLSRLRRLEKLHLQDNQLTGTIPLSLGSLTSLHELFLENNNLTGEVPGSLIKKSGLNFRYLPGNSFSPPSDFLR